MICLNFPVATRRYWSTTHFAKMPILLSIFTLILSATPVAASPDEPRASVRDNSADQAGMPVLAQTRTETQEMDTRRPRSEPRERDRTRAPAQRGSEAQERDTRRPRSETRDRDRTRVPARRGGDASESTERPDPEDLPVQPSVLEFHDIGTDGLTIRFGGHVGDGGGITLQRQEVDDHEWQTIRSIKMRSHGDRSSIRRIYTHVEDGLDDPTRYCYQVYSDYEGERSARRSHCVWVEVDPDNPPNGPSTDPVDVALGLRIGPFSPPGGQSCTGTVFWSFEPVELTGTEGFDEAFQMERDYNVTARQQGDEVWCTVSHRADRGIRAGTWRVRASVPPWSAGCSATLEHDGQGNIVNFTRNRSGCAIGARNWP